MTTTTSTTQHAVSADGTRIAYETHGSGPALVVVAGALCSREMGPSRGLADALQGSFTVHLYDRRDRGESDPGVLPRTGRRCGRFPVVSRPRRRACPGGRRWAATRRGGRRVGASGARRASLRRPKWALAMP